MRRPTGAASSDTSGIISPAPAAHPKIHVTLECPGNLALANGSGDCFLQGITVSPALSFEALSAKTEGPSPLWKFSTGMGGSLTWLS